MDPQFEELAGRITNDVAEAVTARVTEVLAAAERRLSQTNLDALTAAEQRLIQSNLEALTAAERRLSEQAQVNVEAVKSEARLAAEGYAATLKSIEDRLDRIEPNIATGFRDRDAVLKNHNDRIVVLENKGA